MIPQTAVRQIPAPFAQEGCEDRLSRNLGTLNSRAAAECVNAR